MNETLISVILYILIFTPSELFRRPCKWGWTWTQMLSSSSRISWMSALITIFFNYFYMSYLSPPFIPLLFLPPMPKVTDREPKTTSGMLLFISVTSNYGLHTNTSRFPLFVNAIPFPLGMHILWVLLCGQLKQFHLLWVYESKKFSTLAHKQKMTNICHYSLRNYGFSDICLYGMFFLGANSRIRPKFGKKL